MANATEMTDALADIFGKATTHVDSVVRALALDGLRSKTSRGRAAAEMKGSDVINCALALAGGAGATHGAAYIRRIIDLRPDPVATTSGSEISAENFGTLLGNLLDNAHGDKLPWRREGDLTVRIWNMCRSAEVSYENGTDRVVIGFRAPGFNATMAPLWDQPIILSGRLMRMLADVSSPAPEPVTEDPDPFDNPFEAMAEHAFSR